MDDKLTLSSLGTYEFARLPPHQHLGIEVYRYPAGVVSDLPRSSSY